MAISFVQTVQAGDQFSGSPQTGAITNTAGNFLILYMLSQSPTNSIGDTLGNTFTQIFTNVNNGGNAQTRLNVWIVPNCLSGSNKFTATTTSSQGVGLVVAEYSGVQFAIPVDASATSVSASNTPVSPSITTNLADDWILATVNSFTGGTVGLTQSGYSARFSGIVGASGRYSVALADSNAPEPIGSYTVSFTNTLTDSGLTTIALKAFVAPTISSQPTNQTAIVGNTATFSVTATGSNLSYQWSKNGTPISGATSATYQTPVLTLANNGDTYFVVVTNPGGSVQSNTVTLTVNTGVYSVPDNRNYGNFPNNSVNVQGTLTYTVPSVDSRKAGAPVDSRKAGAPVDSRVSSPQNSRQNPPF